MRVDVFVGVMWTLSGLPSARWPTLLKKLTIKEAMCKVHVRLSNSVWKLISDITEGFVCFSHLQKQTLSVGYELKWMNVLWSDQNVTLTNDLSSWKTRHPNYRAVAASCWGWLLCSSWRACEDGHGFFWHAQSTLWDIVCRVFEKRPQGFMLFYRLSHSYTVLRC